jgi:hypothetical protein
MTRYVKTTPKNTRRAMLMIEQRALSLMSENGAQQASGLAKLQPRNHAQRNKT